MAYFHIQTDRAIDASHNMMVLANRLRTIKEELDRVSLAGTLDFSSRIRIDRSLMGLGRDLLREASEMNSLGAALEVIVGKYREAERKILGDAEGRITSTQPGTDKRNGWDKFWDWALKREPDNKYEATSIEQEKAADAAIKTQLWYVLQQEKYSQDAWERASVNERKQILQDYMNEVIKIYGLEDVKPKIKWDSKATYTSNSITWGYYSHGWKHTVTLNEQALTDSVGNWDSYELLGTVSHELRHAYQHEAVDHPTRYMVSKETIDSWRQNFRHYISSDEDYAGYRDQAVEVDARNFEVSRDARPQKPGTPQFGHVLY